MILGFTGSRVGLGDTQRAALYDVLRALPIAIAHHGDCVGADAVFHVFVREAHPAARVIIHPPDNDRFRARMADEATTVLKGRPYLDRNKDIVACSEILVACPSGPEELRSGTWSTVRHARRLSCPVVIVWPDGTVAGERLADEVAKAVAGLAGKRQGEKS